MAKTHKDPNDRREPSNFGVNPNSSGDRPGDRVFESVPEKLYRQFMSVDPSDWRDEPGITVGPGPFRHKKSTPDFMELDRLRRMFMGLSPEEKRRMYAEAYGLVPPRIPLPPEDVEITEETEEAVFRDMIKEFGEKPVFQAMAETVAEMGDLSSVLMVMRGKIKTRLAESETRFKGDYRW